MTESPTFLSDQSLRFLMFGGKGGVGKTTIAAATALHWAHRIDGDVLVVSTDPAHSLADAFEQLIGDLLTPILGEPRLFAREVDAGPRLHAFKERYGSAMSTIVARGTYFDDDDIRQFLELSLPGLDELMAVLEVAELVRERAYALVILDTAPTGHTLRLLATPALLARWLHVLDLMLAKHRYMQAVFGRRQGDETDAFMNVMTADLDRLRTVMTDPRTTEFVPVTIPEAMSVSETRRLIESLAELGVPVRTVVVNRVARAADATDCPFCAQRWQAQQPSLNEIAARCGPRGSPAATATALGVPLLPHQVHGRVRLQELAGLLQRAAAFTTAEDMKWPAPGPAGPAGPPASRVPTATEERTTAHLAVDGGFVLVGGKGGVGKTTIAAATAISLARQRVGEDSRAESRGVLLFSADPAHSLSDCLRQDLGSEITQVQGVPGLAAYEIEASSLLADMTHVYAGEAKEAFAAFGAGGDIDVAFDAEVMQELISLAPPGLDELMCLMRLMDLVDEDSYAAYVLDLAPTGHALRLLETPDLVRQWFMVLFRVLLKYKTVFALARAGELLRQKSKQLRAVQRLLADAQRCQLLAVAIPEQMAVQETRRLLSGLSRIPVHCSWVVANLVSAPGTCAFCAAVSAEQRQYLEQLDDLGPACAHLPAFAFEPRGVAALERVGRLLWS